MTCIMYVSSDGSFEPDSCTSFLASDDSSTSMGLLQANRMCQNQLHRAALTLKNLRIISSTWFLSCFVSASNKCSPVTCIRSLHSVSLSRLCCSVFLLRLLVALVLFFRALFLKCSLEVLRQLLRHKLRTNCWCRKDGISAVSMLLDCGHTK